MMRLTFILLALVACDDEKFTVEKLQDPNTCKDCHPKHYDQWSGSMHAYASDDPVFVAMNRRGQRDTGGELGDFCIKCHAPMAVELGIQTGANFDPKALPPEARGITCYFCHNVASVEADHNNGLVLAMDQTMRGGAKNASDNPAHHSTYDNTFAGRLHDSSMCGSCHDVVTPKGVHIERTFAEWKDTVFAREEVPLQKQTCNHCHMKPSDGLIADKPGLDVSPRKGGFHDHSLPSVDLALTPVPQMDSQNKLVRDILDVAVQITGPNKLGGALPNGGICLDPPGILSVRLDSINVGHKFPSGAAQDRRTWLQVIAYRADNSIVYQSGVVPDGVDPENAGDPNLKGFWDRIAKEDGSRAHFFWEVGPDKVDSQLLLPAVTLDINSPLIDHSTTFTYQIGIAFTEIDHIEAQLMVRPLAFEMVDELIASGDLDPSVRTTLLPMTFTPKAAKSIWRKATSGTGPAEFTNCNPDQD